MTAKPELLDRVLAMESSAFRVGQLARAIEDDHKDLWQLLKSVRATVTHLGGSLALELDERLDAAQEWGQRLGISLTSVYTADRYTPSHGAEPVRGFEHLDGEALIDGVLVRIEGCRLVGPEEWAARQAAAGGARS